ncbi:MAG TPA: class I SAM-dependent methyltransferase [Gemmatimonadaceae bacterium]|nr:class I SAM-dependent methyltransferase [Gemmatimonadaceae bacterium]
MAPPRARARLYLPARVGFRRAVSAVDAVWTGLWLGAMSREDLNAVDASFYDGSGMFRSDAHNRRGLFDWEERAIAAHFPPRGSLLVVGAGGGREMLALSGRGYAVEGFECNPELVAFALDFLPREGCRPAPVRFLPRDQAPPEGGPYDAALAGWSVYMLIAGRERRVAFLRGIRPRLRDGAPLLISFFTRPFDAGRFRVVRMVAGAVRRLRGDEPVELGDDLAPNFVHRFTRAEVEAELAAGGFRLAGFEPQGPGLFDSGWAVALAETGA